MTAPRILVREGDRSRRTTRESEPAPELGWRLLGGLGGVFALVAGADLLLAWYPPAFSNGEWKFGTVTTTLNSFPLFAMGLLLLMGAGLALGRRRQVQVMTVVLAVIVVTVVFCAVLYVPQVPKALAAVTDPNIKLGLRKAIVKTCGQLVMYTGVFSWIALKGFRQWRSM